MLLWVGRVERIVGIGLDEEDMEVFLTIDGKYRGVVADKQAVETALFGEIMRGKRPTCWRLGTVETRLWWF